MRVVHVMNSRAGRAARALAGLTLIGAGAAVGGPGGLVLALVGIVPLAAGVVGVCLTARLLRVPLRSR